MSKYDDEYEDDDIEEEDDPYADEVEDEDEDDEPPKRSPVNPFSGGGARPATPAFGNQNPPGNRFGNASNLPGSPNAPRPGAPGSNNPPGGNRPAQGGSTPPGGNQKPATPAGGAPFNRPSNPNSPPGTPPARSTGTFGQPPAGGQKPPAPSGGFSGGNRPAPFGGRDDEKRDERPASGGGNRPAFGSGEDKRDDRSSAQSGGNRPAFGGRDDDKRDDRSSAQSGGNRPAFGSKPDDKPAGQGGFGGGNRPSSFGAKDDDKRDDRSSAQSGGGNRPSSFGAKPSDRDDDKKDDKSGGGLAGRLGGGLPKFGGGGGDKDDKKDDKSGGRFGLPKIGGGDKDDKKDEKSGGGLAARLPAGLPKFGGGGDKDYKKDEKSGGGLAARLPVSIPKFGGGGDKDDKKDDKSGGGRFGLPKFGGGGDKDDKKDEKSGGGIGGIGGGMPRFGGGGDKPAPAASNAPAKPLGGASGSAFGAQGRTGTAPGGAPATPKAASAPKTAKPSLKERIKGFSLFKKPDPKTAKARASKAPTVRREGMPLDTKLDILGVALVLSSLALVFSALSPNQGQITGGINTFLSQTFGWGALAVPIAMFAAGVWLILRHFGEDAPVLDAMRVAGIVMLYIGLLVVFQYIDSFSYTLNARSPILEQLRNIYLPISYALGRGGGWIGAEIYYFLVSNITEFGGFFVLLAWLIIGGMLTLSLSAAEMAIIVISVWRSFNDARKRRVVRRAAMLAEREALSAAALPAMTVTKPQTEALPAGAPRSPALPAPAAAAMPLPDLEGRSIPITQGGRTVTASFRPGEPVTMDAPAAPAPTRPGLPFAPPARPVERGTADIPAASAEEKPAAPGRFGGFAARVREAIPTGGAKPDDHTVVVPAPADADKPAAPGRFGGAFARMKDAIPTMPTLPGAKPNAEPAAPADTPAASPAPVMQPARPMGVRGTGQVAAAQAQPPAEPAAFIAADPAPAPVLSTPTPISARAETVEADAPATPQSDDAKPPTFGSLLRPSSPPSVRPSPFARPPAGDSAAASAANGDDSKPAESGIRRPFGKPADAPKPDEERPAALRAVTPAPVVQPVLPDDLEDEDDDIDSDDIAAEIEKLPPARPKGVGPLPRPSLPTPFSRSAVPPPRDSAMQMPAAEKPAMGSLQERLAALRSRDAEPKPDTQVSPPAPAPAASVSEDTNAVDLAAQVAAILAEEKPKPASAPVAASRPAESAPPQSEKRPLPNPRIVPLDDDDDEDEDEETTDDTKSDALPTLTKPVQTGVRPSGLTPPSRPAFTMPERPTPPAPAARGALFSAPDTPPAITTNPRTDAPAPPPAARKGRKDWKVPEYAALLASGSDQELNHDVLIERARKIEETLDSFGAPGRVVEVRTGPVITQFGVEPDYLPARGGKKIRIKVSAIAQLDKDLQLALGAKSIRIEAPVPGKGYVGIEVPNEEAAVVRLRDVLESQEFRKLNSPLAICLGQGVDGTPVAADLASMPHLLIAGTTGSGKSVCVNTIIASLLLQNTPDKLKFIMVDPKRVELTGYNGIPHLVAPVVVELERIVSVLKWVTREMDERYKKFSSAGARNIEDFNKHLPQGEQQMPYIVVIIDELADLMMLAPDETERVITRIAALARATGIHLVIATQRPSVDVVTGLIKANFPARIAFAVAGSVDSRVILDQPGAERLLGRGDMLYMSGDSPAPVRLQGVYVSDNEINNITRFWRTQMDAEDFASRSISTITADDSPRERETPTVATSTWAPSTGRGVPAAQQAFWDRELSGSANNRDDDDANDGEDAMYDESVELVRRLNKASVSLLQRRLRIGYTRAARLIDMMEERGVVGPATEGSKPREVLPAK